jgi:hypothetical protein
MPQKPLNISCIDCSLCLIEGTSFTENSSSIRRFFNCTHVMCSDHYIIMRNNKCTLICPDCRSK